MDYSQFVEQTTSATAPPLVPEITLHLAQEVIPLWQRIEAETGLSNTPPPYWAFAWAGGQAMARYLLDHPDIVAGKAVLDFGAGSGLIALAGAKAGATCVTAADIDPFAAAAMAINAAENDTHLTIETEDIIGQSGWPVILVGDMCYERPLAERLLGWLRAESARGTTVLLGDPGRNYFPRNGVIRCAEYDVPCSRELEDRDMRRTGVYRL